MVKFLSYNNGCGGLKALCEAGGWKRLKHSGKRIRVNNLICWGKTSHIVREIYSEGTVLNEDTEVARNKLLSFEAFREAGVIVPDFTTNPGEVGEGLWVARKTLTGHSGKGIEIFGRRLGDISIPEAPLYVRYIPKKEEYRVHVFLGKIIFVQRKARRLATPDDEVDWQVRNHDNGFIFQNQGFTYHKNLESLAISAIDALGLDFGAVDIIYNERRDQYYVLEVNTAPGLTGETVEAYKNAIEEWDNERQES